MATVALPQQSAPVPSRWQRLSPAEGWTTVLLHLVVVLAAAWTVHLTPMAPDRGVLAALAAGGLALGFALGKLGAPDLLAHLVSFLSGSAAAGLAVALGDGALGPVAAARSLGPQAAEWFRRMASGRPVDDPAFFTVVLGLTVWLVAYTSAWTLYRRGWLATALFLPGTIAFVNLGLAQDPDGLPLVVLIAAGCVLAARYHAYRRQGLWSRGGLAAPPRLPTRFLWAGVNLALVAALLGWTMPISAREGLGAVWERVDEPWSAVQERWDEAIARIAGDRDFGGGSYASFGDQFRLGGALNLSDDPVMTLRPVGGAADPTYLAGHRYDAYNGHGWSTRVSDTFDDVNADGRRFSAQMTFARGQGVHLGPNVTTGRVETQGEIEVLRPKGDLMFTRDTFLSADRQVNVQLSWRRLENQPYRIAGGDLLAIPLDLRNFAATLASGAFDPVAAAESPTPAPLDPALAAEIGRQRAELQARFLEPTWTVGPDGLVDVLYVTGQLPVYDDVEAVFASESVSEGERYEVTGLLSTATPDALRTAGVEYPDWLRARYLQLPDTVTPRTRDLAAELAAAQPTPFDAATAIQDFLRGHITYNEKIAPPPREQDVVDYVLFDSREGYCEYYASAMAVMLRSQGIPARVVGGYFPAPWDEASEGFLYREKNAHLWVEVFFPGYGWIPFEPTASQAPLEYGADQIAQRPEPTPTPEPTPEATRVPLATPPASPDQPLFPPDLPGGLPEPGTALGWAGVGIALAGLLAALAAAAAWQWRLRGLSPATGLYARALRAGRIWGVRPDPAETPQEYAARLGQAMPATGAPARVVADLYSQEVYAGRPPAPGALAGARAAWSELRRMMLGGIFRRRTGAEQ